MSTDQPSVDEHMNIVQAFVELERAGDGTQPQRRALERQVRQRALDLADRLTAAGLGLDQAAQYLGVSGRTLRHWEQTLRQPDAAAPLLGRPRADSGSEPQQAVRDHLQSVGAGASVPALREQFPSLARAELDRLVKDYRESWRQQHRRPLHVLHWQRPGTVWAMDFAEAPALIDGSYPYLLAVRDLASGKQLLWRPVLATTAEVVRAELTPLFGAFGAPWVLKSDNGPAFRADDTKRLLCQWGVFPLFSPPHRPAYNGAIEAAIGSLKFRTQRLAERTGHPELWTSALVEAARRQANATARPRRLQGATPDKTWDARAPLPAEGRERFRVAVQHYQTETREQQGPLAEDQVTHWTQAAVDRVALRRALVAHDLLLFTRGQFPHTLSGKKRQARGR
jgi:transposase InsO family protein